MAPALLAQKPGPFDCTHARYVGPLPRPTLSGPICESLSDAGNARDARDAGKPDAGMLKLAMQRMLAGMLATAVAHLQPFSRLGNVVSGASRKARDAGDVFGFKCLGWAACR